ncbi:hypothetical protein PT2222_40402 [Paraburkholderia tropica]
MFCAFCRRRRRVKREAYSDRGADEKLHRVGRDQKIVTRW